MSDVRVEETTHLSDAQVVAVRALAGRAADADGVDAISEAFRLALTSPRASVTHHLAYAGRSGPVGYAARDATGSAELVVDPGSRRRGVGLALLRALLDGGATSIWAHGDLPAARALAESEGLVPTRELHVMERPVRDGDDVDPTLPDGFEVRAFEPGRDEQAWLDVNRLAFATHPEQGSITLEDLQDRMAQDWFDASGFLLVEDTTVTQDGGAHPLAAFHWTKREPGSGTSGEVYVVGVHPAYQGRGLAGPLTGLGTAYLTRQGVDRIELYVDGDNTRALATYRRAGFEDAVLHVVYGRAPAP